MKVSCSDAMSSVIAGSGHRRAAQVTPPLQAWSDVCACVQVAFAVLLLAACVAIRAGETYAMAAGLAAAKFISDCSLASKSLQDILRGCRGAGGRSRSRGHGRRLPWNVLGRAGQEERWRHGAPCSFSQVRVSCFVSAVRLSVRDFTRKGCPRFAMLCHDST